MTRLPGAPDRSDARWLLAVLTMAYVLAFMDRQFLSVVVEPIRRDLELDDLQIGWLTGLAFAACYTLVGLPISRLADRSSRPAIITVGVLLWSAATAASGLAQSFSQLFMARMAIGIGEAVLLPTAFAMLGDAFPTTRLSTATGIFMAGSALGAALALIGGGPLVQVFARQNFVQLPAWRFAFLVFGALGVCLAVLTARLKDYRPVPTGAQGNSAMTTGPSLASYLRTQAHILGPLTGAGVLLTMFGNGFVTWLPAYFQRVHHWNVSKTGVLLGTAILGCGVISGPFWGWLASNIARRRRKDPTAWLLLVTVSSLAILATVGPLQSDARYALALTGAAPLFTGAISALVPAAIVGRSPPRLRAQVMSLFLVSVNLVGISVGPLLYAWAAEKVFGDSSRLDLSLSVVSGLILGLAALTILPLVLRTNSATNAPAAATP